KNLGLGEAAKRGVGTGSNQIPDMSFFKSLNNNDGYITLPGGLIIQYGRATTAKNNAIVTHPLPIAFPKHHYQCVLSHDDPSSTSSLAFASVAPNGLTAINITAQKLEFSPTSGTVTYRTQQSPCYFRYIAIGD
ncbi:gp53-like domain-containing protein, partial [Siccibacter turicensis]|uniref:gp53-like domain-containing protein n=1 Tax=Siccibacter turicensis TaxID=357233 RepID=UPI003F67DB7A